MQLYPGYNIEFINKDKWLGLDPNTGPNVVLTGADLCAEFNNIYVALQALNPPSKNNMTDEEWKSSDYSMITIPPVTLQEEINKVKGVIRNGFNVADDQPWWDINSPTEVVYDSFFIDDTTVEVAPAFRYVFTRSLFTGIRFFFDYVPRSPQITLFVNQTGHPIELIVASDNNRTRFFIGPISYCYIVLGLDKATLAEDDKFPYDLNGSCDIGATGSFSNIVPYENLRVVSDVSNGCFNWWAGSSFPGNIDTSRLFDTYFPQADCNRFYKLRLTVCFENNGTSWTNTLYPWVAKTGRPSPTVAGEMFEFNGGVVYVGWATNPGQAYLPVQNIRGRMAIVPDSALPTTANPTAASALPLTTLTFAGSAATLTTASFCSTPLEELSITPYGNGAGSAALGNIWFGTRYGCPSMEYPGGSATLRVCSVSDLLLSCDTPVIGVKNSGNATASSALVFTSWRWR